MRLIPKASEYEEEIRVLKCPQQDIVVKASVDGFREYFLDRLRTLRRIMLGRGDMYDVRSIAEAKREGEHVKIVGLVYDKRVLGKSAIVLTLEDETGMVDVVVTNASRAFVKAMDVLNDSCIGIEGRMKNGTLYAEDIIFPDIKAPPRPHDVPDLSVVLISDLHVGSKMFFEKSFRHFIKWLKGEVDVARDLVDTVKYIIIAGDLVDGVGIYPGQDKELLLSSLYKQYEALSAFLSEIPDHIEIIVIPGNHDATVHAVPYVPIFREYAEPLYEMPNVHVFGDPLFIELHGVKFLISHGRSLDDIISALPGASFSQEGIIKSMRHLLKVRHLAPIYGGKTPIIPLDKDFLVIDEAPHVFHMGHVHVYGVGSYKGILLVNTGTWQGQTAYQRTMGIEPTPGVVAVVRLSDMRTSVLNFHNPA